jgi:RHS repeat-associated protein
VITDSAANVVETYSNDEYGDPLITLSAAAPNNAASQPRQYTAEPRDPETGFIYLRARMYDPSSGRFLQRDIAPGNSKVPTGLGRYPYVAQNPLSRTDPTGHCSDDDPDDCAEEMGRGLPEAASSLTNADIRNALLKRRQPDLQVREGGTGPRRLPPCASESIQAVFPAR